MTKRRTLRSSPRTGINSLTARSLNHETLEKRELLAFDLVSVTADVAVQFDLNAVTRLDQSPREISFQFDDSMAFDPAAFSSFTFTASGGDRTFGDGNETGVTPDTLGLGATDRIVVATFVDDLPNDTYRVNVPEDAAGLTSEIVDFQLEKVPRFTSASLGAVVRLAADEPLPFIEFGLDNLGVAIDATSVNSAGVTLRETGQPLAVLTDYTFAFSATNNTVRLTSLGDFFRSDAIYEVILNSSIKDTAGNSVVPLGAAELTTLTIIPSAVATDFGDAPSSYGTLFSDGGPLHVSPSNGSIILGSVFDAEIDASPSLAANSDDLATSDDEDGLSIGTIRRSGRDYYVFGKPAVDGTVPDANVQGVLVSGQSTMINVVATGDGFLDAWIDFNRDGAFDATDRIAIAVPVTSGNNLLTVNTPSGLVAPFDTYARLRVSSAGNLAPTGVAVDGEVEDYRVTVAATDFGFPLNTNPTFDVTSSTINKRESQTIDEQTVANFLINLFPGDPNNPIENQVQSIASVTVTNVVSDPGLLISGSLSVVTPGTGATGMDSQTTGDLKFATNPGLNGQITFDVTATDNLGLSSAPVNVTLSIQPVNAPPRFKDPLGVPVSDQRSADDGYSVARIDSDGNGQIDDATITYTFKEDNTQPLGATGGPIFIPLTAGTSMAFNRIGLLDVFEAGPSDETAVGTPGGNQGVSFVQAGNDPQNGGAARRTDRGGSLTPVTDSGGKIIGLNYQPPKDFNSDFGQADSFTYWVVDDNPLGGESFDEDLGTIEPDPKMSSNKVRLVLNPVNDRPEFTASTLDVSVAEDAGLTKVENYATAIAAGPLATAFDENSGLTRQNLEFTLVSLDFPVDDAEDFFAVYPSIDVVSGELSFQTAADVFGAYRFEVTLNDDGMENSTRGDLISSIPITLAISVRPVNDPPRLKPNAAPLRFVIQEDQSAEFAANGSGTNIGLLDVFTPGPSIDRGDEGADLLPSPGGNQTISLRTPFSNRSTMGGTIRYDDSGASPKLIYRPRPNFVGTDTYVYSVIDNGQTVDANGVASDNFRTAVNTVTIEVTPVNDAPIFSGAGDVLTNEQSMLGAFTKPGWATNVQAGPTTATDEVGGTANTPAQTAQFVFNQISGDTGLFAVAPTAVIDSVTQSATLTFQPTLFASGVAVFEVTLEDDGPSNAGNGDKFQSEPIRTTTVTIRPINDPPTATVVKETVTVREDQGPVSVLQVDPFGPSASDSTDEQDQTVSFIVQPLAPEFARLFSIQPKIDNAGFLKFTTAPNLNSVISGPVPIVVTARDSGGTEFGGTDSSVFTFNIAITEVDDAPRAVSDPDPNDTTDDFKTNEDTVLTLTVADLIRNDNDPDLDSNPKEKLRLNLQPSFASASGAAIRYDAVAGTITYDPTDRFVSPAIQALMNDGVSAEMLTDSFAYSLIDSTGLGSNLVTVAIEVSGINDAPFLKPDTPFLNPDGPTIIAPLANDIDIDGTIDRTSIQITLLPAFGSLDVQDDGTLIYTPFGSFSKEDVFRYSVADNFGSRSDGQLVTIAANASPIAVNDSRGTFLGEGIFVDVSSNDSDPNGNLDLAGITIVRSPLHGEANAQSDGTVQYQPDPGFVGTDTFDYQIADDQGRLSNVATARIQVVASRLQNPDRFSDVNADGFVTAIDALLIVNRLSRSGMSSIPVSMDDRGPNYYDTNGDQSITANDALVVVNDLQRINNRQSTDREQVFATGIASGIESRLMSSSAEAEEMGPIGNEANEKLVDVSNPLNRIDHVIDSMVSESTEDDTVSGASAVDEVLAGLF